MLQITSVKNVALENVQFPANSVILIKYSERETNNGIDTTIKFVAVDGVKDTKQITSVKVLLSALIAEYKTIQEFNNAFAVVKDGNGKVITDKSGIQAKRIISPFLSGNTIYKTDSNGKLSGALECEKGVKLRDTALNIKNNQAVTTATGANLKAAIHNQANAIVKQSTYLTTIDEMKAAILAELEEEKEKKATKKAEKEVKEQTEKAA